MMFPPEVNALAVESEPAASLSDPVTLCSNNNASSIDLRLFSDESSTYSGYTAEIVEVNITECSNQPSNATALLFHQTRGNSFGGRSFGWWTELLVDYPELLIWTGIALLVNLCCLCCCGIYTCMSCSKSGASAKPFHNPVGFNNPYQDEPLPDAESVSGEASDSSLYPMKEAPKGSSVGGKRRSKGSKGVRRRRSKNSRGSRGSNGRATDDDSISYSSPPESSLY